MEKGMRKRKQGTVEKGRKLNRRGRKSKSEGNGKVKTRGNKEKIVKREKKQGKSNPTPLMAENGLLTKSRLLLLLLLLFLLLDFRGKGNHNLSPLQVVLC